MRLQLILCDMLMLPVEHLAAESAHDIVLSDLSASLHVEPLPLRDRIQEEIDPIDDIREQVRDQLAFQKGYERFVEELRRDIYVDMRY